MKVNFYYSKEIDAENLLVGYLHALNSFYQNNGFFVLPYPIANNVRSVFIPKFDSLVNAKNQKEIAKYWNIDKFDLTGTKTYKQLLEELESENTKIDPTDYENKWSKISRDFEKCYRGVYGEKLNIIFDVFLVNYRTTVTVLKVKSSEKEHRVTIALRKDSDINQAIIGIIIATTGVLQNTFYGPKWYNNWEENMSNVDYINKYTVINKFFGGNPSTIEILRESSDLDIAKLSIESYKHLKKLELSTGTKLRLEDNRVYLDKRLIPFFLFTKTELKTLKILVEKENELVTYDEIAESMWENSDEKFSYWAISKHISRIKSKLKSLEGGLDKVVAKRGEGYILIN